MKLYTANYDADRPSAKAITVPLNSTFGVAVGVADGGVQAGMGPGDVTLDGKAADATYAGKYAVFTLTTGREEGCEKHAVAWSANGKRRLFELYVQKADLGEVLGYGDRETDAQAFGFTVEDLVGVIGPDGQLSAASNNLELRSDKISSVGDDVFESNLTFRSNSRLVEIDLPNLTSIGHYGLADAFYNAYSLSSVNMPKLESVGEGGMYGAFKACYWLPCLSLPGLTSVGADGCNGMLSGCQHISAVDMHSLVTAGQTSLRHMCAGCAALKSVDFAKLSYAGEDALEYAFSGCSALELVSFVEASAVPAISESTFEGTNDAFSVVVPDGLYAAWIADGSWAGVSSHVAKASDYAAVMTPYGGQEDMDN